MPPSPTLLFVYGTLLSGEENEAQMLDCVLLGAAATEPGWILYQLDGYPGMVRADAQGVVGEVWEVPAHRWPALDAFEGVAEGLYERVGVQLAPPWQGRQVMAYVFLGDVAGRPLLGASWRDAPGRLRAP